MVTLPRQTVARAILLLFVVTAAAFCLLCTLGTDLNEIQKSIVAFGIWGPVIFFAFYVFAVVMLVPGSVLALAAGIAYGMWGLPLALAAATTGAAFSFLIARHLARIKIQAFSQRCLSWQAVERSISESGWRIVGMMRLSPLLPFNLLNYFFGTTRISLRCYFFGTLLGIVPGTTVNVSFAATGHALTLAGFFHPLKLALFVVGLVLTIAVGWFINRKVRIKLLQTMTRERHDHEFPNRYQYQ